MTPARRADFVVRLGRGVALVGMKLQLPTPTSLFHVAILAIAASGCVLDTDDNVQAARNTGDDGAMSTDCFATIGFSSEIVPIDLHAKRIGNPIGTIGSSDISSLGLIDNSLVTCTHDQGLMIV